MNDDLIKPKQKEKVANESKSKIVMEGVVKRVTNLF